jgi:hypothetical protein
MLHECNDTRISQLKPEHETCKIKRDHSIPLDVLK